ncbi:MAG: HAMP domain-containing histidine kinase [Actinomycetota bacterium]|nr:HAMP domain-containing histidine kinase [Actinomycetota bacterium]
MPDLPEVAQAAVLAAAGLLVLANLVTLLVSVRRRRAMDRRLSMVLARLDVPGASDGNEGEDGMTRLERLAESAVLRVSEAEAAVDRMTETLDELPLGVVICDERSSIVYRNRTAKDLGELGPEESETEDTVKEVLRAGLAGDRRSSTIEMLEPPQRTLTVAGRPLDDGRRVLGAVAVVEDISDRRRFDLVRQDFVDNVTAELRAPLGALGLLASTLAAESEPKLVGRLAERLRADAVRMGRIVDDVAELSRISAEATPERQLVPVHLVVAQAVEEVRSMSGHSDITIDAGEAPTQLVVLGNRRQLVSAVRRLVENAVEFAEGGSAVRVVVRRQDSSVEIDVIDQGPGVPPDELDRIFESFYRVGPSRSRDTAGTGLGLAIVSQVASGHGGDVQVTSTGQEGSTFTLRLPVRASAGSRWTRVRVRNPRLSVSDAAG